MSQSLENALVDPDDNAACHSLHELLARKTISASPARPATAKAYLEAFCDQSRHITRRRWTGLLLARLLESCRDVAHHLRQGPDDLVRIGAVILGLNEAEETKVVAGLIIRAGLSQGIKFSDFWTERKVHTTATLFPTEADASWLKAFQDYMETISGISPESSSPKLVLLYPVAFTAADGYRWSPHDENLPLLLIENQTLTIITPASTLHEIEFVYIPLRSIKNVRCQPSSPYDSQGAGTPVSPWAVVLQFASISAPYQVNCSEHSGSDFTVILETMADAKDCVRCINDTILPQKNPNPPSPTPNEDLSMDKVTEGNMQALSQGGVVMFDRSQREGSIVQGSQQADQAVPEVAQTTRTEAAHAKRGALPEVKKTSQPIVMQSVPDAMPADFEFPDHSPSIKRPSQAKTKKPPVGRIGTAISQILPQKSNTRKPAASKSKLKNQDEGQVYDDEKFEVNVEVGASDSRSYQIKHSLGLTKEPEAFRKEARRPHRQPDVFDIPKKTQGDEKGARGGMRRTRAVAITYKEDTSSEAESSASEFAEEERVTTSRIRPSMTANKKEHLTLSPIESATSKRRTRNPKARSKPLQPLNGSLLSNLQSTAGDKGGQKPKILRADVEEHREEESRAAAQTKRRIQPLNALGEENPSSEAHILGKLNDSDSDDEPSRTHALKNGESVASKKRTAASITPSTPRHKRAKLNHDEVVANAEVDESTSVKPPNTVAPIRVLEDPSSPCGSRGGRSMQAPPKPTAEESVRMSSPNTNPSTVRSRKDVNARQTPVQQLGKRSHSSISTNPEILSSNSKPTPAPPRAASSAISGHADQHQIIVEQAKGEYKIEKSDPFRADCRKINKFTRKLTGNTGPQAKPTEGSFQDHPIELGNGPTGSSSEGPPHKVSSTMAPSHTGISQPIEMLQIRAPERSRSRTVDSSVAKALLAINSPQVQPGYSVQQQMALPDDERQDNSAVIEGDTLIDLEEQSQIQHEVHIRSSPPPMDTPSSHSSTSAESEPKTDPPVPTSQADEMEWEVSLQPYQRDLKDQLLRVSNRVLQHIIDNESAVNDIADTYAKDGQQSLQLLLKDHEEEFSAMNKDFEQKKANLKEATEKVLSKLRQERQKIEGDDG